MLAGEIKRNTSTGNVAGSGTGAADGEAGGEGGDWSEVYCKPTAGILSRSPRGLKRKMVVIVTA